MSRVTLLGPQRLRPTLGAALESLGLDGPIATVTAGWQERESDDRELHEHLGGRSTNLRLYQRTEEVFRRDADLAAAHHERQAVLRRMQDVYATRLDYLMEAARVFLARPSDRDLVDAEAEDCIASVRALDARHLQRVAAVHAEFATRWTPLERPAVRDQRLRLAEALAACDAVAIAGGHVAVLLNRLRLFDVAGLLGGKPVVAWSAGAMALCERIVLFHDHPAFGDGNAEVLEHGLGLCRGVVPLPHARRRLHLDDTLRVGLMARRFAPAVCVAMDDGARLDVVDGRACGPADPGAAALGPDGRVAPLEVA
jgi:hypothetical protein